MRWLFCFLFGCCGAAPSTESAVNALDIRCAEDCGSYEAVFDNVTHEIAVTGEDSWRCFCLKGPEKIQIW